jgi:hypothetical protein
MALGLNLVMPVLAGGHNDQLPVFYFLRGSVADGFDFWSVDTGNPVVL